MKNSADQSNALQEQAVFSLPPALLREAKRFAKQYHNGNNSGFVAAAIRGYIDHLRKVRHTTKLRASYAAAAKRQDIAADWDEVSEEAWSMLDAPSGGRA